MAALQLVMGDYSELFNAMQNIFVTPSPMASDSLKHHLNQSATIRPLLAPGIAGRSMILHRKRFA
jgi:hypothetical protein